MARPRPRAAYRRAVFSAGRERVAMGGLGAVASARDTMTDGISAVGRGQGRAGVAARASFVARVGDVEVAAVVGRGTGGRRRGEEGRGAGLGLFLFFIFLSFLHLYKFK